ncbi:capsule biosynthesis GfcC family protein [Vibrio sp.]|uniref:capsule biosynthesis GfcC family protein n=1 Tax=Vibrio sp. TaxID=678 RepID=UPI003D0AFD33
MNISHWLWLLLTAVSANSLANTLVNVNDGQKQLQLQYQESPRLEQVLSDTLTHSHNHLLTRAPAYAYLYQTDSNQAQQNKQLLLNRLQQLSSISESLQGSVEVLHTQLLSWQVGDRKLLPLDYDLVRIEPDYNPKLTGQYQLLLPQRPTTIQVEGLVFEPQSVRFAPGHTARDYLRQVKPLSSADNSHVWAIYPDGSVTKLGYAYWNHQQVALPPGTVLFLGFANPSAEIMDLEQALLDLIKVRKPALL